jgi:hypothetical protein
LFSTYIGFVDKKFLVGYDKSMIIVGRQTGCFFIAMKCVALRRQPLAGLGLAMDTIKATCAAYWSAQVVNK